MSVKLVTPAAAASDPKHPDHARWVKERTLGIEADHALAAGLSFRQAEEENARNLERLERRRNAPANPGRAKRKAKAPPRNAEHARIAGVVKRASKPEIVKPRKSACNWCGLCLSCKRETRLRQIMGAARLEGAGSAAHALTMELVAVTFASHARRDYKDALGRELPFSRLRGADAAKARIMGAEWVCDRSESLFGKWR